MASGTATTAPSTATTTPSTAPLPLTAGQSSTEPLVPIVVQIEAQDTPSVIQGARPVIGAEQKMQSTQVYGTLPYFSGPPYMAPLPYAAMPAMSARPSLPMGYYGMPNPNWMISEREHALQQQLIQERQQFEAWKASQAQPQPPDTAGGQSRLGTMLILIKRNQLTQIKRGQLVRNELDLKTRALARLSVPGLLQHLADPPPLRGTTLGGLAQPQGHLRPVLDRQSIRLLLPRTLKPLKLT